MALIHLGDFTLGQINIGLLAGLGLLNPMIAQLDLILTGSFGLGGVIVDIQAQFNAAISAVASIGLSIGDPLSTIRAQLMAIAQIGASLQLLLAFGIPAISLSLSAQLSASAALTGTLSARLGGIKALVAAGIAVKLPAVNFLASMGAAASLGPVHLLSFTGNTLAGTGGEVALQFAAGLGPSNPILPTQFSSGLILVTKDPAVFAAMGVILKTS